MFRRKANDDHRGNTTKSRARKNSQGQAAMPETVTNALRFLGIRGYGDGSWVKCLLHTPKDQNAEPQHGYVCCNPSFWKVKEQNPGSYWPATLAKSESSRFSYRSSLRKKMR